MIEKMFEAEDMNTIHMTGNYTNATYKAANILLMASYER